MVAVISGTCRMKVLRDTGKAPHLLKSRMELELSDNLNADAYKEGEDFTEAGCKCYTRAMVMGIASMIKYANQKGYIKTEDYYKHVMKILEEAIREDYGDVEFTNEIF